MANPTVTAAATGTDFATRNIDGERCYRFDPALYGRYYDAAVRITASPDGALWFTTFRDIGRVATAGAVTMLLCRDLHESGTEQPPGHHRRPRRRALCLRETSTDRVGRVTTGGGVTEYSSGITAGASPDAIAARQDGALWFTETGLNRIGTSRPAVR